MRLDNDAFARRVWGRPWAKVFAADIGHEFTPNDFEMCRPDESTEGRLGWAIREMTAIVEEILLDPALAVEAPLGTTGRDGLAGLKSVDPRLKNNTMTN